MNEDILSFLIVAHLFRGTPPPLGDCDPAGMSSDDGGSQQHFPYLFLASCFPARAPLFESACSAAHVCSVRFVFLHSLAHKGLVGHVSFWSVRSSSSISFFPRK